MPSRIQFQYLADKYAPGTPEIAETLAKLQLPPHSSVNESSVPLPRRNSPPTQHDLAIVIRDGRRVASKLASVGEASKTTESTRYSFSHTSPAQSSMSTALEQDFTVEGKKGNLQCPFSKPVDPTVVNAESTEDKEAHADGNEPGHPVDPICAAMAAETDSQSAAVEGAGGSKCPIRYMDQHSPEEIAHYVETHKHALPRSHEVCLRRYQRNEDQIRKLDSKYGNIVSMIEGLGQLHQPMLPESEQDRERRPSEVERASNERVQTWAEDVPVTSDAVTDDEVSAQDVTDDRQSHFDRPLRDVRVGESPSRPWGIHVPVQEPSGYDDEQQPFSPPPAPVRMPSPSHTPVKGPGGGGKCPFDHTRLAAMASGAPPSLDIHPKSPTTHAAPDHAAFTPANGQIPQAEAPSPSPSPLAQPSFINPAAVKNSPGGTVPQMVFTGPVFIGYPMDQALQILNQYRPNNG